MEGGSDLNHRRSKRQKTQAPSPSSTAKGKEKMEEPPPDADPTAEETTCGICLSDGGRSIRGRIDSCDHYFCFICIMEWAKVETRCPMCKQRFRSIRRPAVNGIFKCERVVDVPERNQVYHPPGNESTTPDDPYADIICSECHTAANEELLLLCDLCDSASHTYCVGLGATVPEGDWYCRDCTMIRDERFRTHSDSDGCNQDTYNSLRAVRASEPPVSISEIVSDGIVSDSSRGFSTGQVLEQQRNDNRPPPRNTSQRESQDAIVPAVETVLSTQAKGVEQGARTLQHCRNLRGRIRVLRENWNALRSGSLAFSSNLFISSNKDYDKKKKSSGVSSDTSRQLGSISSASSEQTADASASSKKNVSAGSRDVNKAWKMMEIAKSVQETRRVTVSNHSLNFSGKRNISKEVGNHNPRPIISKDYIPPHREAGHTESEDCRSFSLKVVQEKHKSPDHEKQKPDPHTMKEMQHFHRGSTKTSLLGLMDLSSSKQDRILLQKDLCYGKKGPAPQQVLDKELTVCDGPDATKYRGSAACSLSGPSNLLAKNPSEPSCCKVDSHNAKQGAVTNSDESLIKRNDIVNSSAKDEVQSLVKLNLKLISRDQCLGADRFKEVARVSTHTILAACGLEHSRSSARLFSSPICKHTQQIRELRKSNLLPNSCRECFYSFVKDVVNSILLEKISPANTC